MSVQIERTAVGYVWFVMSAEGNYLDSGIELTRPAARKAGMEALNACVENDAELWLL